MCKNCLSKPVSRIMAAAGVPPDKVLSGSTLSMRPEVGILQKWTAWNTTGRCKWLLISGASDPPKIIQISQARTRNSKDKAGSFLRGVNRDFVNMETVILGDPNDRNLSSPSQDFTLYNKLMDLQVKTAKIRKSVKQLFEACNKTKEVPVLYYTGHGENGTGNWCAADGTISIQDIIRWASTSGCPQAIIISDTCFSGHWANFCLQNPRCGLKCLAACAEFYTAWDTGNGSDFTLYITGNKSNPIRDPVYSDGNRERYPLMNPRELNILLLGQTGVGKSTFINGFANYIHHKTLSRAEAASELTSPVTSQFTITDDDTFEVKKIITGNFDNESIDAIEGQSATQKAKTYVFKDGGYTLRLIDTPGVGDTRGVEKDKENFKHILSYISNYDEIHGICILLKPNESRLDVTFKFCITELLTHLHRNAVDNMVFCFTNARNTNYKPGDTMQPLKALIAKHKLNDEVTLRKEIVYCLDNETFRYLAAIRNGIKFEEIEKEMFTLSWERTRSTMDRMIQHFAGQPAHKVRDTLSLNETRRTIVQITKPMADMSKHIFAQIDHVNAKKSDIQNFRGELAELNRKLYVPIKDLERRNLGHPRTVCTSRDCTSTIAGKRNYNEHCHPHCKLEGVETDEVDNADLRRCNAMNKLTGVCKKCGCNWSSHMHVTYENIEVDRIQEDKQVKKLLNEKSDKFTKQKGIIEILEAKIKKMEEEQKIILNISAKFGCELKRIAITPYNDVMISYINHQINEELDKTDSNPKRIEQLRKTIEEYQEEIKILNKSMNESGNTTISAAEIKELKQELLGLEIFGRNMRNLLEFDESATRGRRNKLEQMLYSAGNHIQSWFGHLVAGFERLNID